MPKTIATSLLLLIGVVASGAGSVTAAETPSADVETFRASVQPFFKTYCQRCHGAEKQKASVRLDTLTPIGDGTSGELWKDIIDQIEFEDMPPEDATQPSAKERESVVAWARAEILRARKVAESTGGKVVLRRLNRNEYAETLRRLLHLHPAIDAAENLPEDDVYEGFDTVGSGRVWLTGHFSGGTDSQGRGKISTHSSVDQLAAEVIGRETRFDSLQLGAYDAQDTILSWNRNGTPLPTIDSPRQLFMELFVDSNTADKRKVRDVFARNRSILDLVTDNRKSLEHRLSKADQQKFDQYLTSVRELEQKITRNEQWVDIPKVKPDGVKTPDTDADRSKDLWLETMYDLIVKAFETDSTRVIAFARNGPQDYRQNVPGVTEAWHPISHHGGNAEKLEMATKINEYLMGHFARFLGKLEQARDADGSSVLHNSLVLYGDSMTDGGHWGGNLPLILAGHAGGQLKQGHHLKFAPLPKYGQDNYPLATTPTANLFVSMLNLAGVPTEKIADSTGPLVGLT